MFGADREFNRRDQGKLRTLNCDAVNAALKAFNLLHQPSYRSRRSHLKRPDNSSRLS